MNSTASVVIDDFISLFFPRYCSGCEEALVRGETLICTRCMLEMPRSNYHVDLLNPFYAKLRSRLPVRFVLSCFKFVKAGRVQHVLHALKYRNKPEIGRLLGRMYGEDLIAAGYRGNFDLIVPIPLHEKKKRRRGYNQSEEFGAGIGEALGIPCDSCLRRITMTDTQTRRSRVERWENVRSVFQVIAPEKVADRRIMLVDDVVTTGATLEAAGNILLDAGCRELSIACIAAAQ